MRLLLRWVADPPLDPSAEDAHSLLQRELAHPEYHEQNLIEQLLRWIDKLISSTIATASDSPPLSSFAAMIAFLTLAIALAWLVSRARRTPRSQRTGGALLTDEAITADELRARAQRALAEGRNGDAVVDGFRALAVRQVELGALDDLPGATAHEVAAALSAVHEPLRQQVETTATLFDAVLYGDRPASAAQAAAVLDLDDVLVGRR